MQPLLILNRLLQTTRCAPAAGGQGGGGGGDIKPEACRTAEALGASVSSCDEFMDVGA